MNKPGIQMAWSPRGWSSERPTGDRDIPEIWCYTDAHSYLPEDIVQVFVHTTSPRYDITVLRDGPNPTVVVPKEVHEGISQTTPDDSYAVGCGWQDPIAIPTGPHWPSGFYLIIVGIEDRAGLRIEREGFFVLRPKPPISSDRIALILTTSTMIAYNDWGGANSYRGIGDDPRVEIASPVLSTQRPIARGMLRKPPGAPRESNDFTPPPFWVPRYASYEWAMFNGYSRHHADAFWATYERPFVVWAESNGYQFDYLTQHDLHFDPSVLAPYRTAVVVGHNEYWSWEMRDAVDNFVDGGGNFLHLGGNFAWQVRLENNGTSQACYKDPSSDPMQQENPTRVSTAWDHPITGRPAAQTMGLSGLFGVYARYGNAAPRSAGGYTIYRPSHPLLADTDLYYGDQLGGAPTCIASFEMDSVDYTFRGGLPYPTGGFGTPDDLEIIGMTWAVQGEEDRWGQTVPLGGPLEENSQLITDIFGEERIYGAGMMATFHRGRGRVFNAGTAEWVRGLIARDVFVERITHNALSGLSY